MMMLARLLHPSSKALASMVVTESGMLMLARLGQPEMAETPMLVTFAGTTTSRCAPHGKQLTLPRGSSVPAIARP